MTDKQPTITRDRDFSISEQPQYNPASVLDREGQLILDIGNDVHWEAIKSPKRLRVLEGIRQLKQRTISALTVHLGETKKALYYHINKLLSAGLIEELGLVKTGAPRESMVYQSCLRDYIIPLQWNPNSARDNYRIRKARESWGNLMLQTYHLNRIEASKQATRNRTISKMNWIPVNQEQKEQIEALYEQLRTAIEEAEVYEPIDGEELFPMQYSLWLVQDLIGTGPLPSLRPIRKRD